MLKTVLRFQISLREISNSISLSDRKKMIKCCRADFSSVSDFLARWLSNDVLRQGFLNIFLTTSFAVRNSRNTSVVRVIFFFSKSSKFDVNFRNEAKIQKNFFYWEMCIWIDCDRFSLLQREYLWSAVNMLTNSPKSSDIKISSSICLWSKCCCADFSGVWVPLVCWLSNGVLSGSF